MTKSRQASRQLDTSIAITLFQLFQQFYSPFSSTITFKMLILYLCLCMVTTSWAYFITRQKRQFQPSFPQMSYNAVRNPFVDGMFTPHNFDIGVGLDLLSNPFMMGGNLNYPTGNLIRPTESIGGTFAYAQPFSLKYGTQLGPYYPFQVDGYEKAIAAMNSADRRTYSP